MSGIGDVFAAFDPTNSVNKTRMGDNLQTVFGTPLGITSRQEYARRAGVGGDIRSAAETDYQRALQGARPDQDSPFGSIHYTTGPDGRMTQTSSLNPEDQARLESQRGYMGGQLGLAGDAMGRARAAGGLNLTGSSMLGSGQQYNQQAEDAIFGRATARLDPMWDRRMEASRTQLLNQGLDPSSEAYKNQTSDLNMSRNDAYSSAMNDAIKAGGDRGAQLFGMDLSRAGMANNEASQMHGANYSDMAGAMNGYQPITGMPTMPGFATPAGPNSSAAIASAETLKNSESAADDARTAGRIGAVTGVATGLMGLPKMPGFAGGTPAASGTPYYLQNGPDEQFAGTPYAPQPNTYPKQPWEPGYQAFPQS